MRVGELTNIAPSVWRLLAANAGPMTGPGTNTYLIEYQQRILVIDPGPADPTHVERIRSLAPHPICAIAVTHTHRDHSPGAKLLSESGEAVLVGLPPPPTIENDADFCVSQSPHQALTDCGFDAVVDIVATPGHASNHLCYLHKPTAMLFTGDHIMNGSTVVIAPPDGDMSAYLQSLSKLFDLSITSIAPGHGGVINSPEASIRALIAHRLGRERKVLKALAVCEGPVSLGELVSRVYDDVATELHIVAKRSLLAHLEKLEQDGLAASNQGTWWRL